MAQFAEAKPLARLSILNYIAQFMLAHKHVAFDEKYVVSSGFGDEIIGVGDLVALTAAPHTKWYISWVLERSRPEGHADDQFALESIEDGEICNWSNVGLQRFNPQLIAEHPEWRWTDKQYAFKDRWWRVCYKERDAYLYLPLHPKFGEGHSVELGVRVRHGFSDTLPTEEFPDWRKITKASMADFYDRMVAAYKSRQVQTHRETASN